MQSLANLFAVRVEDDTARAAMRQRMEESGSFDEVRAVRGGWLVAIERLPKSTPDGAAARDAGLFFAEGRNAAVAFGGEDRDPFGRLIDATLSRPRELLRLTGDVGFVLIRGDTAHIVRSAAGLVPFHVRSDVRTGTIAITTRLLNLHRFLPAQLAPDCLVHATWTDGVVLPDNRTPIAGVRTVSAGHVAAVRSDGHVLTTAYWDPTAIEQDPVTRDSVADHAAELRALLLDGLADELDEQQPNLIGLSGGVDSSSLGALAAGVLGRPLVSFTMLPARDHPSLASVESYVDTITAAVRPRAESRFYFADTDFLDIYRSSPRLGIPVAHPALILLPRMLEQHDATVVYTGGEFADDLFGGPFVLWHDWTTSFRPRELASAVARRAVPGRKRTVRRWAANHLRGVVRRPWLPYRHELPEFVRDDLRAEYAEWIRAQQWTMATLPPPYRGLEMMRRADGWVLQNWEVCSALGVRRSLPFYRRAVIELAYRCSPRELAMPAKNLLRTGLAEDVPLRNLLRVDKGTAAELVPEVPWTDPLPTRLASVVRAEWMDGPGRISLDDAGSLWCLDASLDRPDGSS